MSTALSSQKWWGFSDVKFNIEGFKSNILAKFVLNFFKDFLILKMIYAKSF